MSEKLETGIIPIDLKKSIINYLLVYMFNSLFNQHSMDKYLRKYKKEFSLTHSRKKALLKWKKKLDNNELKDEVANYGNFSRIILEALLGYDYDEDVKENKGTDYGPGRSEFVLYKDKQKFMVIELKGSNYTDLDKPQAHRKDKLSPVEQGFKYVQDSKESLKWVLISNYDEFRLYNYEKRSHEYISFKIEELLEPETFKKFMLVFSRFSTIDNNLIEKLVSKTVFVERDFENEFYKLYHETRLMLIAELEHIHPEFTRDESVHYAQIIMNRYIFICFAEDLGLLPEEISVKTIGNPVKTGDFGHSEIWHRLNNLFIDVDEGNGFKKIYGYNGGLFKEDLESLKIRDVIDDHSIFNDVYQKWKFEEYSLIVEEKLSPYGGKINPIYKNLMTISTFNFSSEVDVNILGHIFENSIGVIEDLKEDTKGRRKKDGIFYTPEYITDYICRNTIIPYLSKSGKSNTVEKLIGEYWGSEINLLDEKVEKIKIVDPACGSGAFLNKATDILLEIHEAIFNQKYAGESTLDRFFDSIEERRKILLNNIYGVDLNEESVEITKLSLFLKVCKKGLKLPNLDENIKLGNSLVDDPEYVDKPFKWEDKFDIVIGNPPWGAKLDKKSKDFIKSNYKAIEYQFDTYVAFMEKAHDILKDNGYLGFIIPSTWLSMHYFKKIRKFLIYNSSFEKIILFRYMVFDEVTAESCILTLKKNKPKINNQIQISAINDVSEFKKIIFRTIDQEMWQNNYEIGFNVLFDQDKLSLVMKIYDESSLLDKIADVTIGIKPYQTNKGNPKQTKEDVKNRVYDSNHKINEDYKPYIVGRNITKYCINAPTDKWIRYGDCLAEPRNTLDFNVIRIVLRQTSDKIIASIDTNGYLNLNNVHNITVKDNSLDYKYLLTILNSKLIDFIYRYLVPETGRVFAEVKTVNLAKIPIKIVTPELQVVFIEKADKILKLNKDLINEINGFKDWLNRTYKIDKFSKKLDKYYELSFEDFLNELKKKKINIKPRETQELLKKEFEGSLSKINPLLKKIQKTDNEIDQMVYELYGLSEDEIKIIKDSLS